MDSVYAGGTPKLTVSWKDEAGQPEQPASATWEVQDVGKSRTLREATAIPITGPSATLQLAATDTQLLDERAQAEQRRVIVRAAYSASGALTSVYGFEVRNPSKETAG